MSPGGRAPTAVFKCAASVKSLPQSKSRVVVTITTITEEFGEQPTKFEHLKVEIGRGVCEILVESQKRRFKADIAANQFDRMNEALGALIVECGTVIERITEKGNQL